MSELKEATARMRYYYEQHKIRWARRYKKPYPEVEGEIGIFKGARWINEQS